MIFLFATDDDIKKAQELYDKHQIIDRVLQDRTYGGKGFNNQVMGYIALRILFKDFYFHEPPETLPAEEVSGSFDCILLKSPWLGIKAEIKCNGNYSNEHFLFNIKYGYEKAMTNDSKILIAMKQFDSHKYGLIGWIEITDKFSTFEIYNEENENGRAFKIPFALFKPIEEIAKKKQP